MRTVNNSGLNILQKGKKLEQQNDINIKNSKNLRIIITKYKTYTWNNNRIC